MDQRIYRGRFAPSPTGPLHAGSLLVAFGSWLLARQAGGEWLVRIEDIDRPREIAGAAESQLRTLSSFGLLADGPVLRQSTRGSAHAAAVAGLLDQGLAFECRCSRSDLAADVGIHRACVGRRRAAASVRLRVADGSRVAFDDLVQGRIEQDVATAVGDFVLQRADGGPAYQLAVVVDDAAQGISYIVRGADLLDSTPRQILLQRALGLPTPRYAHLPLLMDAQGRKLSKSNAAAALHDDRPLPALRQAWTALGQDPAALSDCGDTASLLARALAAFDRERIPRQRMLPASLTAPNRRITQCPAR